MKMKRVTVQLTIECPEDLNPLGKIRMGGGQATTCKEMAILKEEPLGEVHHVFVQKKAEFLTVRKILNEGLKLAMPRLGIRVYGSRNADEFTFWADINLKYRDANKTPQPRHLINLIHKYSGHTYTMSKGVLYIRRNLNITVPQTKVTTISLGNPNIVQEIAAYVRKVLNEHP